MSEQAIALEGIERSKLVKRGRQLEYLTIGWNTLEAIAALIAGVLARSIALVSFGFDWESVSPSRR